MSDKEPGLYDLRLMLIDHINNMLSDPKPVDVDYATVLIDRILDKQWDLAIYHYRAYVMSENMSTNSEIDLEGVGKMVVSDE